MTTIRETLILGGRITKIEILEGGKVIAIRNLTRRKWHILGRFI
jgi:hypothetical protein